MKIKRKLIDANKEQSKNNARWLKRIKSNADSKRNKRIRKAPQPVAPREPHVNYNSKMSRREHE